MSSFKTTFNWLPYRCLSTRAENKVRISACGAIDLVFPFFFLNFSLSCNYRNEIISAFVFLGFNSKISEIFLGLLRSSFTFLQFVYRLHGTTAQLIPAISNICSSTCVENAKDLSKFVNRKSITYTDFWSILPQLLHLFISIWICIAISSGRFKIFRVTGAFYSCAMVSFSIVAAAAAAATCCSHVIVTSRTLSCLPSRQSFDLI